MLVVPVDATKLPVLDQLPPTLIIEAAGAFTVPLTILKLLAVAKLEAGDQLQTLAPDPLKIRL
jgi:hypothetical protein